MHKILKLSISSTLRFEKAFKIGNSEILEQDEKVLSEVYHTKQ